MFLIQNIFAQLEFTQEKRLLFIGTDSIQGKNSIAGCYITPIDSFHLKLEIDILDNWIQKEKIMTTVEIDPMSIKGDVFKISSFQDSVFAYRFINKEGFEVFIEVERHFTFYAQGSSIAESTYAMGVMQIHLPPRKKYYVRELPLFHCK